MPTRYVELIAAHEQWLETGRKLHDIAQRAAAGDREAVKEFVNTEAELQRQYAVYVALAAKALGS